MNIHTQSHTNLEFGSRVDGSPYASHIGRSRRTNRKIPRTNYVTSDNYVPSDYYDELM